MVSIWLYTGLITATAVERVAELVLSRRNATWSFERGGKEFGRGHFPWMVALHTVFLVGCLLEPWLFTRPFIPALGWSMLALVVGSQALRWWTIHTLGHQWNTRVIVVPEAPRVSGGPFRFFPHPNYVAVVIEGFALPLVHSAWVTAIAFTSLNLVVLAVRVRVEERALSLLHDTSLE